MARKRKYTTEEEMQAAYAPPEGYEDRAAKRRRMRNRSAALSRFRKQEQDTRAREAATAAIPAVVTELQAVHIGPGATDAEMGSDPDVTGDSNATTAVATTVATTVTAAPIPSPRQEGCSLEGVGSTATFEVGVATMPSVRTQGTAFGRRRRDEMTLSQLARVRAADAERKRRRRANRSESQVLRDRATDAERARTRRTPSVRIADTTAEQARRDAMTEAERAVVVEQDANRTRERREIMTEEERAAARERDAARARERRDALTDEQKENQAETRRYHRRARQYKLGLANLEDFEPSTIPGGCHYFSRFVDPEGVVERFCPHCNAWKFPGESKLACCLDAKVHVAPFLPPPQKLQRLFTSTPFMKSIRAYNNVFAFTSVGATRSRPLAVDANTTRRGVYNLRVMGSVCHRMGALLPPPNGRAMYAQIYINDPDMSARVSSRMRMTDGLDASIVEDIDSDMVNHNPYAQQFLHAREILIERSRPAFEAAMEELERRRAAGEQIPDDHPSLRLQQLIPREDELRLRMHVGRNDNPGTHNIPTASEVAAIIIDQDAARHRDIVLHARGGGLKHIYEISEHYDPLQYPLLLPRGEPGWTRGIPYAGDPGSISGDDPTMSLREFYAYLLHDRTESNSLLLRGGCLTQQYWVDQWTKAEQERLRYIEKNQLEFRLETIQGLTDVMGHETIQQHEIAAGDEVRQGSRRSDSGNTWTIGEDTTDAEGRNIGRRLILPPKFTGGPRYMYQ